MRTFDQASAKAYFIDQVVSQAKHDGTPISEAERYNLAWSESDPQFVQDAILNEQFEQETTSEEFEKKVSGLIKRAYQSAAASPDEKSNYKEAYRVLSKGDHYILVMLDEALGMRLKSWWPF